MIIFLVVFFLIYGGMHAYLFVRVRSAGILPLAMTIPFILLLLLMVFMPVIVRYAEQQGHSSFARMAAWAGFSWMGWLLLFSAYALVYDLFRGAAAVFGKISRQDVSFLVAGSRRALLVILGLSVATTAYGYFEARKIRTEYVHLPSSKLPPAVERLRIVQISDVHVGLINREEHLRRIAGAIKKAEPDILVSTGDMVDGQVCTYNGYAAVFNEITPKYGKFAVTGNHEFYAGLKEAKCFHADAGFTLLRGQRVTVGNLITIAGVDDPTAKQMKLGPSANENDLLANLPPERFRLLLKHRPLVDKSVPGLFDLQLSGHVHKGQIFPFSLLTWLYYPVQAGLADLGGGSTLYVSRGTGTWGPPLRVLSPPEVTVIDIIRKAQ
ncbi:MAG: metallophosphoesterase [Thermodesulfovibrio sp.]|nr:metallophosphoesterase [Thermodesulfovibrio sp.]